MLGKKEVVTSLKGVSLQGWVVQKSVNANPGLNLNWSIIFSYLKMFLTSKVWCSLRLLQLKTDGQTVEIDYPAKSYKTEINILANPWLA